MKLCIVSDSHDRADPLAQAVQRAKEQGAEVVIHCGDVIGTQTLRAAMAVVGSGLAPEIGDSEAEQMAEAQARAAAGTVRVTAAEPAAAVVAMGPAMATAGVVAVAS